MMYRLFTLGMIIFVLAACASGRETSNKNNHATTEKNEVVEIDILKYKFIPQKLEIKSGQTVRWVNKEKRQYHSVWFEKNGEEEYDYLFPGDSLERKFDKPGVFEYRCGPHPEMTGKIIVK